MLQDSMNSWRIFSTSCWLWKRYHCKCCWDGWSGSWLARGQVNMVVEAKLCSPINLTVEVLVVQHAVGHCRGEELGPFCWPVPAAGVAVFSASHRFAEHTSQMQWFLPGFKKLWWISLATDHRTVTMTFFGKSFEASSWSKHWAACCRFHLKSTSLYMLQSDQEMVCCCCCIQ